MDYLVIFGSMIIFFFVVGACFLGVYQHWTHKDFYKKTTSTESRRTPRGRADQLAP